MTKTHKERVLESVTKDIETLEDGYKAWWPLHGSGYLLASDLRIIADYLDELNADWDKQVQEGVGSI